MLLAPCSASVQLISVFIYLMWRLSLGGGLARWLNGRAPPCTCSCDGGRLTFDSSNHSNDLYQLHVCIDVAMHDSVNACNYFICKCHLIKQVILACDGVSECCKRANRTQLTIALINSLAVLPRDFLRMFNHEVVAEI